jgi:DNA replication protein DnaC
LYCQQINSALLDSEMPKRYSRFNTFGLWENLPAAFIEGKITAILAAREMVRQPCAYFTLASLNDRLAEDTTPRHSLIIFGANGMGKTALASTIANCSARQGIAVEFITPRGLWFRIKRTFNNTGERETNIVQAMIDAPILVIDEFNLLPSGSDYFGSVLEHIIRERYNSEVPKPVVVTTNAEDQELSVSWGRQITAPLFEMSHRVRLGGLPLRDEGMQPSQESF